MNKTDTSRTLRQLAARMRQQVKETDLPDYQAMMQRTANTLDAEAERIADRQALEFSSALQVFSASQLTTRYH